MPRAIILAVVMLCLEVSITGISLLVLLIFRQAIACGHFYLELYIKNICHVKLVRLTPSKITSLV
jgi:hypothetical protein